MNPVHRTEKKSVFIDWPGDPKPQSKLTAVSTFVRTGAPGKFIELKYCPCNPFPEVGGGVAVGVAVVVGVGMIVGVGITWDCSYTCISDNPIFLLVELTPVILSLTLVMVFTGNVRVVAVPLLFSDPVAIDVPSLNMTVPAVI